MREEGAAKRAGASRERASPEPGREPWKRKMPRRGRARSDRYLEVTSLHAQTTRPTMQRSQSSRKSSRRL